MQLKNDDLALVLRALIYYSNHVVGHEDLVEEYQRIITKVKNYQNNYSVD